MKVGDLTVLFGGFEDLAVEEGLMGYQLVGVVKAHQG